jgi:hypothetical protein
MTSPVSYMTLAIPLLRTGLRYYLRSVTAGLSAVAAFLSLRYGLSLWDLAGRPYTFVVERPGSLPAFYGLSATRHGDAALAV